MIRRDGSGRRAGERWDDRLDDAFALLADGRRRFVLAYLRGRGHAGLFELANVVVGWEQTRREGGVGTREDRDRIATRLHHVDLPTLADSGIVSYDSRSQEVRFEGLPSAVEALLAEADDWQSHEGANQEERSREDRDQDEADPRWR